MLEGNSGNIFSVAIRACLRSEENTVVGDEPVISVIFSQVYLETFINEIIETVPLFDASDGYNEIMILRGRRMSIKGKYDSVKLALSGQRYDGNAYPFRDFVSLVKLRNFITHMEPVRGDWSGWCDPTFLGYLETKNLLSIRQNDSWYQRIKTRKIARWACQTAIDMCKSIADAFPDGMDKDVVKSRVKHLDNSLNKRKTVTKQEPPEGSRTE